jgi:hypothetical protein
MKSSSRFVLIENPLTGNTSTSRALKLSAGQIPKWSTPREARASLGSLWGSLTKIVLVRDPVSRFCCGVSLCVEAAKALLDEAGASESFANLCASLPDLSPGQRSRAVLAFLKSNGFDGAPVWLRPQSEWLTAKFDLVLATHNIAEFFNHDKSFTGSVYRVGEINRGSSLTILAFDDQAAFNSVYAADIEFFRKLRVWSPRRDEVRLVSGYCTTCSPKVSGQIVDLTEIQEVEEVEEIQQVDIIEVVPATEPPTVSRTRQGKKRSS